MVSGSSYLIVILERADAPEARAIRTNWDDRIIPRAGERIDMYWSNELPGGWENGVYSVVETRAGVLDADPKNPRSQPSQLTVCLERMP